MVHLDFLLVDCFGAVLWSEISLGWERCVLVFGALEIEALDDALDVGGLVE